jgi:hypothetical protein
MRRALLANVLYSINAICYKKSMNFAKISEFLFTRLREFRGVVIAVIFILIFGFNPEIITWQLLISILLILAVFLTYSTRQQRLYREEKLSHLLPYENLHVVFTIIAGFLVFRDTSVWTFLIALLTFAVSMAFTIDFKKLTFPKQAKLLFLVQIFIALETLLTGRVLKTLSNIEYFIVYQGVIIILLTVILIAKRQFKDLKKTSFPFHAYMVGGALTSQVAWIIYLLMVGELGVVLSTLLSFL